MNVTGEQKLLAIIAHLAYLLGGMGLIIAPLIIMILKKDDPFVYHHAKQALVAHFTVVVLTALTGILTFLLIGLLLLPVVAVLWLALLITSVIATVKALNGDYYQYPLIQGLVAKL